ncbi:APC family permease [Flavobacterium capsici]|uniref:APC family permease n=1 Tax=Flavobacterium capsici TaxID=3075618 RepID=A0AA96EUZ2_9FLAO|nr:MULTISPECIES: APC family permease [unclassified Flavobacterium]WNM19174.1 APC family permease [Flavobacterium sp. PMR2A8]WNM20563.1 APC family permease [Flavobacterium sp. PMTSA4]
MSTHKKLKEFAATAICGNDITSSCLYVSALAIMYAGQYAWISLLIVAGVLYLFRKIYGEAVGALPLNGGAYNILLNTTSKSNASIAACLTILSYMATAVLSASEAMHYLHSLVDSISVFWATIGLLTFFLLLIMAGIKESSNVAIFIFVFHLASMLFLIGSGIWFAYTNDFSIMSVNFKQPINGSIPVALFLGFSTAMLGISGFESSANFVEEQDKGVFRKTLRNMWIAVSVINPLMALVIIGVVPMIEVGQHQETLLSHLGSITGGSNLGTLISIDAVLVLSGAVLTSYVGVSGLMKRMSLDRILPQALIKENKSGSSPRILFVFFLLCVSVLLITNGELRPLAGVYTMSFLAVMAYFGFGNFLLKIKRSKLPRPEYAQPYVVAIAIFAIIVAIYGNIKLHPEYLVVFLQYFVPSIVLIFLLLNRKFVLQYLLVVIKSFIDSFKKHARIGEVLLTKKINRLTQQEFVYFSKGDNISQLNKAILYVEENEITKKLKIVTIVDENKQVSEDFMSDFNALDRAYPEIKLEYIQLEGKFGPDLIEELSQKWKIPTNFMFISSPGDRFSYRVSELNGVRLIM